MTENETKRPRLYISEENIQAGKFASLSEGQAHYLRNVMRMNKGDTLRVFNGHQGEWLADIKEINKKNVLIGFVNQIHQQKSCPDIWVLASPVKKDAFDFMVEKSCELGAARFCPVICAHTVVHRVNAGRLNAVSIEAAEQSERLDLMPVMDICDLKSLLKSWDKNRKIIFCMERAAAPNIARALQDGQGKPLAVLVGPEGGFSPEEMAYLQEQDFVIPVSLGPRILRAETALVAALSCVQAIRGDWALD